MPTIHLEHERHVCRSLSTALSAAVANATAVRWIGRLLTETPRMTLKAARWAIAMVEPLPRCQESLNRLAQRR